MNTIETGHALGSPFEADPTHGRREHGKRVRIAAGSPLECSRP